MLNFTIGHSKTNILGVSMLLLLSAVYALCIVMVPFPKNIPLLLCIPLFYLTWLDIQAGIVIWLVLSTLGNMFVLDVPILRAFRPAHLILILLLCVWMAKSPKDIFIQSGNIIRDAKNRVLLLMLSWITISMLMGRIEGVTQKPPIYQFAALLSIVLTFALSLIVANHTDRRLLRTIIITNVALNAIILAFVIITGLIEHIGPLDWKTHYYTFLSDYSLNRSNFFTIIDPLFLSICFFGSQEKWGKGLFLLNIILSSIAHIIMFLSGSRTDLFPLVSLGFIIIILRPRLGFILLALIILPIIALNVPAVGSWVKGQTYYTVTDENIALGPGNRIALASDAIRIISKHPLWGTGSDFYRYHTTLQVIVGVVAKQVPTAHNTWLQIAADSGIPASILFAIFCFILFKDSLRCYRSLQNVLLKRYTLLFLAGFCTLLVGSFFGEPIFPVFTGTEGDESVILASYLVNFWLNYGLFLGITKLGDGESNLQSNLT